MQKMLDELNDKEEKTDDDKDAIKLLEDQKRVLNLMEASITKRKR